MSILDDAIREHLELKRAHGADDSELKRLEDEAFGPPQRPDEIDPFAEAPTEFLVSPAETPATAPGIADEAVRSGRRPDIADLQEAPPAPIEELAPEAPTGEEPVADAAPQEELAPLPDAPPPSPADAADIPLPPPVDEAPAPPATDETSLPGTDEATVLPGTDEAPSPVTDETAVHDAEGAPSPITDEVSAPPGSGATDASPSPATDEAPAPGEEIAPDAGPDTEERHAIADQPTQMFDVQAHVDAESAEAPPAEQASPTDDELIDAAQDEPHAAPPATDELFGGGASTPEVDAPEQMPLDTRGPDAEVAGHPPAKAEPSEEESAEYDFFNEQRLSDELDQALEAPLPPTDEHIAMPRYEDAPPAQGGIFDFESEERYEEDPSEEVLRRHDAPEPPSEEAPRERFDPPSEEYEPASEEYEPPSEEYEAPSEETPRGSAEQPSEETDAYDPDTGHEDVLEDTPRFLEDADDDDLWFEQKPPKDFDL